MNKYFIFVIGVMLFSPVFANAAALSLINNLYRGLSDATTGGEVTVLQSYLLSAGYFNYPTITGFFGSVTEAAVQKFQAANGIVSSGTPNTTGYGRVGPRTRAKFFELTNSTPPECGACNLPIPLPPATSTSAKVELRINGGEDISMESGEEATLTWKTENVTDCMSDGVGALTWASTTRANSGTYELQTQGQFGSSSFELTCKDSDNNIVTGEAEISVTGAPEEEEPVKKGTAGNDQPILSDTDFLNEARVGVQILLRLEASDRDNDNLMWTIDWGDGDETTINMCPSTRDNTLVYAVHEWTAADIYSIEIEVFDCRGKSATSMKRLNVLP